MLEFVVKGENKLKNNKSDYIVGILLILISVIVKLIFLLVGYNLLLSPLGLPELSTAHLFGIFLFVINLSGKKFDNDYKKEASVEDDNKVNIKYIIFYSSLTLILFILSLFI